MYNSLRMESVQSPIIPVVGELIRSNPGTISLGQGVAYYGPPPEAIEAIQTFLADPENNKYKLVQGIPQLQQAIKHKVQGQRRSLHSCMTAFGCNPSSRRSSRRSES